VMSLRLPALRERRGDILPLARRAMQACARGGHVPLSLSAAAERKLLEYHWPGNARELTNIVQRAAWLATGGEIHPDDLDMQALAPTPASGVATESLAVLPAAQTAADAGLGADLKERERELILATLRVTGGSRKLAAERLGISPRTLRHKLQQLKAAGVTVPRLHDQQFMTA
jgi:two-component system response regulator FlrC